MGSTWVLVSKPTDPDCSGMRPIGGDPGRVSYWRMLAECSGIASCKVHGRPWASGALAFEVLALEEVLAFEVLAFCAASVCTTGLAGFGVGRVAAP